MKKIYAVILAAGTSSRLGFNKLTIKIDGNPVIRRAVEPFCIEGIENIFIVVNPEDMAVRKALEAPFTPVPQKAGFHLSPFTSDASHFTFIENPHYTEGMSSSVKNALPYIVGADAVLFHLGDKPFIKRETVAHMLNLYQQQNSLMIVPQYKNEKGHPVMMKVGLYLEEMKLLKGDRGLREIIDKNTKDVVFIDGDEGSVFDIDTVETLKILQERGYRIEKG